MKRKPKNIRAEDWDAVESPPLSEKLLSRMKPVKESNPDMPARVRGSQKTPLKVPVSIRLSPDVVDFFKSHGKGWQTKINNILHEYMRNLSVAKPQLKLKIANCKVKSKTKVKRRE